MAARRSLSLSFRDCCAASPAASQAARGASKKAGTRPELALCKALWAAGLRYQKNAQDLTGKPDIVFRKARVAVFCDGDFWHGRDWAQREAKLATGNNAAYWLRKIQRNMQRDLLATARLERAGWRVLRLWEGEIRSNLAGCVQQVSELLTESRW